MHLRYLLNKLLIAQTYLLTNKVMHDVQCTERNLLSLPNSINGAILKCPSPRRSLIYVLYQHPIEWEALNARSRRNVGIIEPLIILSIDPIEDILMETPNFKRSHILETF